MNRDDKLIQVAAEFGFDPDEEIRIGGKYTPVLVDGSTAYIAGQIPRVGEVVHFVGVVGESVSLDDGRRAAGISALRALSLIRKHCGTLDAIATVPRITEYVRSAPGFTMQSEVADGASDVLYAVHRRCGRSYAFVGRRAAIAERCFGGSGFHFRVAA